MLVMEVQFPTRNRLEEPLHEDDYQDWSSSDDEKNIDEHESGNEVGSKSSINGTTELLQEFSRDVDKAIGLLGGAVFPKLSWSAPIDAIWIATGNTLKCTSSDEVMLLLKSSDRVAHDLTEAVDLRKTAFKEEGASGNLDLEDHESLGLEAKMGDDDVLCKAYRISAVDGREEKSGGLNIENFAETGRRGQREMTAVQQVVALREWFDLKPGREFRCFVLEGKLLGISQRDITQRFDKTLNEAASIKTRIIRFHNDIIAGNFSLEDYTYDCYVPTASMSSIKLIDFNPVYGTTSPLLFSWEELQWSTSRMTGAAEISEEDPPESMRENGGLSFGALCLSDHAKTVESSCNDDRLRNDAGSQEEDPTRNALADDPSGIEMRLIAEDTPIRPVKAVYGIPYDFIDMEEGSALSSLLKETQGAEDLWHQIRSHCGVQSTS